MASHSYELARRHAGALLLGAAATRITWEFDDLTTADGHQLRASFFASVRAIDDPTEKKMLEEVLLGSRNSVSAAQVMAHFQPSLRAAAQKATKDLPADRVLADAGRGALCELLKKAAGDLAFGCGLELLPPIRIELDSPTLTQQQIVSMQRTLAEQESAGRVEHFQKAVDLLKQFETQRGGASSSAVTRAIESLGPADRGAMLKTLLLAGSARSASTAVWVVAATTLIRIDLTGDVTPTAAHLPDSLGPTRSLQAVTLEGQPYWAIGARDGVLIAPISCPADAVAYRDGVIETTQGFSRVIVRNGQIIACHSEAGLVSWTIGSPDRPAAFHRPSELGGSPRHLTTFDGSHTLFAVGPQLMTLADDESILRVGGPCGNEIVGIVPDGHRSIIAYDDGTLRALERATRSLIKLEHRGQRIAAITALPWLGGRRLLLAGDDGAIDCVGIDDDLVSQYLSHHRGVRRLVASASHVAALSGDRSRVIVWTSWEGKSPAKEVSLARITPHRIADLELT